MGLIQNMLHQWRQNKEQRKEMETVSRWEDQIQDRKMTPQERDLLRYQEEERQKQIKIILAAHRKREMDETWSGKKWNPVHAENVFANEQMIFKGKSELMKGQKNLLKNKNMLKGHKSILKQKNMFTK